MADVKSDDLDENSDEELRTESILRHVQSFRNYGTHKNYQKIDSENWIVRNLCLLAARQQGRDIRFLDFGAGGGLMCNAARVYGVQDVIAYDPFYSKIVQEKFNAGNFPGIKCILTRTAVSDHGLFDAVVFQGALEHVVDPLGELQFIFENITSGGYLYVNNPIMDLENELSDLVSATKIIKRLAISHYHPWHLNYMMPRHFEKILKDVGFTILPTIQYYPPASPGAGAAGRKLVVMAKTSIRWLQNRLGLPYKRYVYIVQKP